MGETKEPTEKRKIEEPIKGIEKDKELTPDEKLPKEVVDAKAEALKAIREGNLSVAVSTAMDNLSQARGFHGVARDILKTVLGEIDRRANPRSASNRINDIGVTFDRENEKEKALGCYSDALELDPSNGVAFTNKIIMLGRLGRYDEIVNHATAFITDIPVQDRYHAKIRSKIEEAYEEIGDERGKQRFQDEVRKVSEEKSGRPLKGAADQNPEILAKVDEGRRLAAEGKFNEAFTVGLRLSDSDYQSPARDVYRAIQEANTEGNKSLDARANNGIGVTYAREENMESALKHFSAAVSLSPSSGLYLDNKLNVLSQLGRHDEVAQHSTDFLINIPIEDRNFPSIQARIESAYDSLGDTKGKNQFQLDIATKTIFAEDEARRKRPAGESPRGLTEETRRRPGEEDIRPPEDEESQPQPGEIPYEGGSMSFEGGGTSEPIITRRGGMTRRIRNGLIVGGAILVVGLGLGIRSCVRGGDEQQKQPQQSGQPAAQTSQTAAPAVAQGQLTQTAAPTPIPAAVQQSAAAKTLDREWTKLPGGSFNVPEQGALIRYSKEATANIQLPGNSSIISNKDTDLELTGDITIIAGKSATMTLPAGTELKINNGKFTITTGETGPVELSQRDEARLTTQDPIKLKVPAGVTATSTNPFTAPMSKDTTANIPAGEKVNLPAGTEASMGTAAQAVGETTVTQVDPGKIYSQIDSIIGSTRVFKENHTAIGMMTNAYKENLESYNKDPMFWYRLCMLYGSVGMKRPGHEGNLGERKPTLIASMGCINKAAQIAASTNTQTSSFPPINGYSFDQNYWFISDALGKLGLSPAQISTLQAPDLQ